MWAKGLDGMFLEHWATHMRYMMQALSYASTGIEKAQYDAKVEVLDALRADFVTFKLNEHKKKKGNKHGQQ